MSKNATSTEEPALTTKAAYASFSASLSLGFLDASSSHHPAAAVGTLSGSVSTYHTPGVDGQSLTCSLPLLLLSSP